MAPVVAHHGRPQLLSHFGLADTVARQGHLVSRFFTIVSVVTLLRGSAHCEGAAIDLDHFELHATHGKCLDAHWCGRITAKDDIDDCVDIGNVDFTVSIDVRRSVAATVAQNHGDYYIHVSDIDLSVAVDITFKPTSSRDDNLVGTLMVATIDAIAIG